MIKWITERIGTASFESIDNDEEKKYKIIDVRDLVDKSGNTSDYVEKKIEQSLSELSKNNQIVICCDYGMSRSNAVAAGIIAKFEHTSVNDALRKVIASTGERSIKPEVFAIVKNAVEKDRDQIKNIGQYKKRVLITGSTGFIGKSILPVLLNNSSLKIFTASHREIDLLNGSIELDLFAKENEIDTILHLANPHVCNANHAIGDTLVMLKNTIDVCAQNQIRLIYLSRWEIYSGYRSNHLYAGEILPALPKGPYGESKYLSEMMINYHRDFSGLKQTILRSSQVYGVDSERPKFMYNFIGKAKKGEVIRTHQYQNGFPALDLLHVSDLTTAIELIIENDVYGCFNVGTGELITTNDIAEIVVSELNSDSMIEHVMINEQVANIAMDYRKINEQFQWQPKISFSNGFKELIASLK
jgi:nucleoside-diphosphate-sugar epimerase/predicted protein tyrosine phosphatase